MNGDDVSACTESNAETPWTGRDRISSRSEALVVAIWALIAGLFMMQMLYLGTDLWRGVRGPVILGGLIVLVVLFNVSRARTRTVRPRYFNQVEGVCALWLGIGGSIATQIFGDGGGMPMGTAVLAAAVLTVPLLACSVWLAVRSR